MTHLMLVNNAGTASVAPLLNADVEKMDDMIALNITARCAISKHFGNSAPAPRHRIGVLAPLVVPVD
jgi:short-subunit dehydrogenase